RQLLHCGSHNQVRSAESRCLKTKRLAVHGLRLWVIAQGMVNRSHGTVQFRFYLRFVRKIVPDALCCFAENLTQQSRVPPQSDRRTNALKHVLEESRHLLALGSLGLSPAALALRLFQPIY